MNPKGIFSHGPLALRARVSVDLLAPPRQDSPRKPAGEGFPIVTYVGITMERENLHNGQRKSFQGLWLGIVLLAALVVGALTGIVWYLVSSDAASALQVAGSIAATIALIGIAVLQTLFFT